MKRAITELAQSALVTLALIIPVAIYLAGGRQFLTHVLGI